MDLNIILNKNINFNLLKKNKNIFIIIFNEVYFIKYKLNNDSKLFYNKNCKSLSLKIFFITINKLLVTEVIKCINFSIYNYYIKKIKFVGKSYKIKKKKKILHTIFNKSHKEIFFWKNMILKKIKKK